MTKSALIENGLVVNVIIGEIDGSIHCDDMVSIGWAYDGANFTAPPKPELPPPAPPVLNRAQWGFFLDLTGFRDTLNAVLEAMPKNTIQERIDWAGLKNVALDSDSYSLGSTLAIVSNMQGIQGLPSAAEIEAAWAQAAQFQGAASIIGGGNASQT